MEIRKRLTVYLTPSPSPTRRGEERQCEGVKCHPCHRGKDTWWAGDLAACCGRCNSQPGDKTPLPGDMCCAVLEIWQQAAIEPGARIGRYRSVVSIGLLRYEGWLSPL